LDYLRPGKGGGEIVIDIKTSRNLGPDQMSRQFYGLGYQIQAAMGWDGMLAIGRNPERYVYAVVRNIKPYMVNCVEAEEPVLEQGRAQYKWFVKEWGKCLETGEFPGYNENGLNALMLPGWAGQEF
jgi:exodeoxyribonuclease VIII